MNEYIIKSGTEKKEFFDRLYKEAEYIILPEDNPLKIENNAFEHCEKLKEITIPSNVTFLGSKAFYWCTDLEKVNLKANIKEINQYTFYYCKSLKEIVLPEGIEIINVSAFCNCRNLEKVILPNSLKWIETSAFSSCPKLKEIFIPKNTHINGRPFERDTIESIYIDSETLSSCQSVFISAYKDKIKNYPTLDELLESGKSLREISNIYKINETIR